MGHRENCPNKQTSILRGQGMQLSNRTSNTQGSGLNPADPNSVTPYEIVGANYIQTTT